MQLNTIINDWGITGFLGIATLLSLIQIAPIKINPWSAICGWIGKHTNVQIMDELYKQSALASRYRIIRFDDECRHKACHTEEHYNQILEDIDKYENYCLNHPDFPNSKAVDAIGNIKKCYRKCKDDNDFLV